MYMYGTCVRTRICNSVCVMCDAPGRTGGRSVRRRRRGGGARGAGAAAWADGRAGIAWTAPSGPRRRNRRQPTVCQALWPPNEHAREGEGRGAPPPAWVESSGVLGHGPWQPPACARAAQCARVSALTASPGPPILGPSPQTPHSPSERVRQPVRKRADRWDREGQYESHTTKQRRPPAHVHTHVHA